MEILGFQVGRTKPVTAAEKPKKTDLEIGDTGTMILKGVVSDEYNTKLAGTAGITVYDEMRRSDGTVRAALLACTLPIRRATWYVESASEDDSDVEIAKFVEDALKEQMSITWDDFLRQALLALPFGVMVFEKVFEIRTLDGVDRIVWKKLAPRLPKSVHAWETSNGEDGIQQRKIDGDIVDIPIEKLVIFVNEKEGDNWWGTSMLRAAYKHWFIKNNFYRIDNIAFERQGLGIPYAKLPPNAGESERAKAETILKNMRAHQQSFVVEPSDYEFGFKDMMARTTRDPSTSIQHHNREIVKSVLAHFLELGATDSGSRALSSDQSDLFLLSIEAVAKNFADVMNKYAVNQIVDLNFDGVVKYPKLSFAPIARTDVEKLANAYSTLVTSKGITAGEADEGYFREILGLPERDNTGDTNDMPPETEEGVDEDEIDLEPKESSERKKKSFGEGDFKSFRKLTFAEQKVDFEDIEKKLDTLEDSFDAETQELLRAAHAKFIDSLTKAVNRGNTGAIKDAQFKVKQDYSRIIRDKMKEAYEYGKTSAAKEIGAKTPANTKQVLAQIDVQADAIAEMHIAQIQNEGKMQLVASLNKGSSTAASIAVAEAATAAMIAELTTNTSRIVMAGYMNNGRDFIFEVNDADIYAKQRSEVLDGSTCNYCLSIDGRVLHTDDPFTKNTIFHSRCRGIWVGIKMDESELPPVGGIPKTLRDRFGDAVNDLIQPKVAQTRKDSLAQKEKERRLKREAKRDQG